LYRVKIVKDCRLGRRSGLESINNFKIEFEIDVVCCILS